MKNIFLLISLLCIASNIFSQTIATKYPNGNIESLGKIKDSLQVGNWFFLYQNGNLKAAGKFKLGNRSGRWAFYDESEEIKSITKYKDGIKNGKSISFYKNGQKKQKGNYVNGLQDGIWVFHDKNGTVYKKEYYKGKCLINSNLKKPQIVYEDIKLYYFYENSNHLWGHTINYYNKFQELDSTFELGYTGLVQFGEKYYSSKKHKLDSIITIGYDSEKESVISEEVIIKRLKNKIVTIEKYPIDDLVIEVETTFENKKPTKIVKYYPNDSTWREVRTYRYEKDLLVESHFGENAVYYYYNDYNELIKEEFVRVDSKTKETFKSIYEYKYTYDKYNNWIIKHETHISKEDRTSKAEHHRTIIYKL